MSSLKHFIKGSSQNDAANLIGASSYLIEFGIPKKTTSGVIIDVAIAPWRRETREEGEEGERVGVWGRKGRQCYNISLHTYI